MQPMNDGRPDSSPEASVSNADAPRLPSSAELNQWLHEVGVAAAGADLLDAAPMRVWVGRDRGITLELRLRLRIDGRECVGLLQGGLGRGAGNDVMPGRSLSADGWMTGIRASSEQLGIWCQSPELDEALPLVTSLWHERADPISATSEPRKQDVASSVVAALEDKENGRALPNELDTRLVGYRIGKRCVMRVRSRDGSVKSGVFVKHFRKCPKGNFSARWSSLSTGLDSLSQGRVRLPSLVAVLPEARAIVFDEIPCAARAVECAAMANDIIDALVAIHRLPSACDLSVHSVVDELDTVARWETGLAVVGAALDHRRTIDRLVHRLRIRSADVGDDNLGVVHRDFHAAQLLQTESALWIVDWDTLALGHVEVDLATFLAHLVLEEVRHGRWHGELAPIARCLAIYRDRGGRIDDGRLRYYLAAALSRLGALQLARGLSDSAVRLMWSVAESIVDGGAPELCGVFSGSTPASR